MQVEVLRDEQWVISQFMSDETFKERKIEIDKNYAVQLQIAKYDNLKSIQEKDAILYGGIDGKGYSLFYIVASRQPDDQKEFTNFMKYFILMLDNKIDKQSLKFINQPIISCFRLIYFNSGQSSSDKIARFLDFYRLLPMRYYTKLVKLYIVHGNMFCKSWLWFKNNLQLTVLKKKIVFISRLSEFIPDNFIGKYQYVLIPSVSKDTDSTHIQLRDTAKTVKGIEKEEAKVEQFQQLAPVIGVHLHELELNSHGFPVVLDQLICIFFNNHENMQMEGIFRKASGIKKQKEVENLLQRRKYIEVQNYDDLYAVSGIFQMIIHKLSVPVFPFNYYRKIIDTMKNPATQPIPFLKEVINDLPPLNRVVLMVTLGFIRHVSLFKDINKMTTYNLSVSFGPSFLRTDVVKNSDMFDVTVAVKVINVLLDNYHEFFPSEVYDDYLTQANHRRATSLYIGASQKLQVEQEVIPKRNESISILTKASIRTQPY